MSIEALRRELETLDDDILRRVAERQRIARRIEEVKALDGLPIRDFARERQVLERGLAIAEEVGLDATLAREILARLIRSSLTVQERHRVASASRGEGRTALVIGGAGRMGAWFVRFLAAQGYRVRVADPAGPLPGAAHWQDWRDAPTSHDLTVVAAPLRASREILEELAERPPAGVVLELGSVKAPLADPLTRLAGRGVDVASIHPLFGPDTDLLSGRHVALIDLGRPRATGAARALFASTMATLVEMTLEEHDRLMAWVLGLSHALNLVFARALRASGVPVADLDRLASPTFDAQLSVARRVLTENPHLYFEIQHLNPHGGQALAALAEAAETLRSLIGEGNERRFIAWMKHCRRDIG
ncbi:MAG: prephenate dehydrogenase/arogenate dehydrogenase family protein [Thermoanaerobaculia bacterium]